MLNKHADRYTRELRDPALAALLKDTFADDPALADSPGRTDRIMRKILTSGVRPAPRFQWTPFAWAGGALATAALAVALVLGLAHSPSPEQQQIVNNKAPEQVQPDTMPKPEQPTYQPSPPPNPDEGPQVVVHRPGVGKINQPPYHKPVKHKPTPEPEALQERPMVVAAVLYRAGATADAAGDYETAYNAYQASYEEAPNPETLLASGEALENITREALNTVTPSS